MVGTIGPLVQGALPRWRYRLEITALFVTGFLGGAVTIFFLSFLLGVTLHIHELPLTLRRSMAAAGLVTLAVLDVWARHKGTYCPMGWRRQTPRRLRHRHSLRVVASIWGFDTGLAITTFRVAAATWGAILLTMLSLSGWQAGMAYGIAFTIPITILMWTHKAGRMAVTLEPGDPGLGELLGMRPAWQAKSAALLMAGAVMLASELVLGASIRTDHAGMDCRTSRTARGHGVMQNCSSGSRTVLLMMAEAEKTCANEVGSKP